MSSIFAAWVLDLLIGDPYWFPHPVKWMGKYINFFEEKVRSITSSSNGLKIGGVLLTVTLVLLTYVTAEGMLIAAKKIHIGIYLIVNILLLWSCIAAKCLQKEAVKVYNALKSKDLGLARKQLAYIVGRDTMQLNEKEITRAAVETVLENTSDGVIAPLFYMFIGGAPLALAYKAINTMDSMVGYKNEKYFYFGWASAKLDDIANYIPARLTGILIVITSFFLNLDYKESFRILKRDRRNHSSPNSAYAEAAGAGALGIQLGGSNTYFGKVVEKPTIGDVKKEIQIENILTSVKLMYGAAVLLLIMMFIWR